MLHASGAHRYRFSITARGKSYISMSSVQNKGKDTTSCITHLLCQKSNGWVLGEGATMETAKWVN